MTVARAEAFIENEIFCDQVRKVDILVGIISDKRTSSVLMPLSKSHEGLALAYPGLSSAVAFLDTSGNPTLRDSFLSAPCPTPRIYQSTGAGHGDKMNGLFNLMHLARRLEAKVIVALDGDLASVKRTWIGRLAQPVLDGTAEYTAPVYHSLKYDTPVTNLFGYPLFRALFGRRLRQPFFTDRAFSQRLNESFLSHRDWPLGLPYSAYEMTMAILAINGKARICQSFMATPRLAWQNRALDLDTGRVFQRVAYGLFSLVGHFPEVWQNSRRSRPTTVTGTELPPSVITPREVAPAETFLRKISELVAAHGQLWHQAFDGRKDWIFEKIVSESADSLNVSAGDWATICLRSIMAFHRLEDALRPDLLKALSAVFYARLLTWLQSGAGLSQPQMEARTEEECVIFEANRPVLLDGWGGTAATSA
ncbi:MAG: hypothetical protein LBL95_03940 [Deltaproteobacteria bacterium]|jgi:hypothetical protein|nr:hypothetical protein [Deltaproteobacteria bacterium]